MKDFAKSIYVGNSNKAEIIEKKKKEGATLKVDNGQKLEFSDGSTYVKTSFSDDYREAHNYTGNKKVGNADVVKEGGKWVVLYAEGTKSKEFDSKEAADKFAKEVGNTKVGNASTFDRLDDAVHYASNLTDDALRRLNGTFSATNLISALSKCKQACDDAIKLAQQYDREINK